MHIIPEISVIVPIYNVEQYIRQCLDSLICQTFANIEIICVDDCGTDNSIAIAKQYAAQDNRIKIVHHDKNSGIAVARNTGLSNCSAPYIMWCDPDDWYSPDMCQKMYTAIETSGADLAVCGTNIIYDTNAEMSESDEKYYGLKFDGLVEFTDDVKYKTDVSVWNKIWRQDIVKSHNIIMPDGLKYEDAYFWRAYTLWCKNAVFVSEKLYNYRRRAGSIMNNTFSKQKHTAIDHLRVAILYFEYLRQNGMDYGEHLKKFWENVFIGDTWFALHNTCGTHNIRAVHAMARQFIRKNYKFGINTWWTDRVIQRIYNKTFYCPRCHMGRLICTKESNEKKQLRVFGIPVWVTRYSDSKNRYYICGLRIS